MAAMISRRWLARLSMACPPRTWSRMLTRGGSNERDEDEMDRRRRDALAGRLWRGPGPQGPALAARLRVDRYRRSRHLFRHRSLCGPEEDAGRQLLSDP